MSTRHRHVFQTGDVDQAQRAVRAAVRHGTPDDDIHIVARRDIEVRQIHDRRKMADSDFIPAAIRGVLIGALLGLVCSLTFLAMRGTGLWTVVLATGAGATIGGLGASLMGSALPDPVRRRFARQIDEGAILIVVDAEEDTLAGTLDAMDEVGARHLPYDAPSAMS